MASLGHVFVGWAAARLARSRGRPVFSPLGSAVVWSGLSLLPDVDVLGFSLGIAYGDPWGHRGATHSFAFALAVGVVVWAVFAWAGRPGLRVGAIAAAVVASHPLLDTLTDGGLGCALWWPVSEERCFAPWRPLPVSPIGGAFFSVAGARVALTELVAFTPLLLYAVFPRRADVRAP